jgi:hypothetical protein
MPFGLDHGGIVVVDIGVLHPTVLAEGLTEVFVIPAV